MIQFRSSLVLISALIGCSRHTEKSAIVVDSELPALVEQQVDDNPIQAFPNSIRLIREEIEENDLTLTQWNIDSTNQIRSMALANGIEFVTSEIDYCDSKTTTVAFKRPDAVFTITLERMADASGGFEYKTQVDKCDGATVEASNRRDVLNLFRLMFLTSVQLHSAELSEQSELLKSAAGVASSEQFERLLTSALSGNPVNVAFPCGPLKCRLIKPKADIINMTLTR